MRLVHGQAGSQALQVQTALQAGPDPLQVALVTIQFLNRIQPLADGLR
jgi:hypothetical protein